MSILVDSNTRLLVQGITGREGNFHTKQMIDYGTNVVGGVTPGKGGEWVFGTVPVFDTAQEAVEATGANTSIIYVPARFAADSIIEAADAGVELVVCITEGLPVLDMVQVRAYLDTTHTRLIGPNCPGLITPGESKVGIIPGHILTPGNVGVVSRSGTLTYEVVYALTARGIGQSDVGATPGHAGGDGHPGAGAGANPRRPPGRLAAGRLAGDRRGDPGAGQGPRPHPGARRRRPAHDEHLWRHLVCPRQPRRRRAGARSQRGRCLSRPVRGR